MPTKHHLGVVLLRFKSFTCWQAAQFTQIAGEDSNIFSHLTLPKQIIKDFWNSRNKVGSFQNPLVSKI